mmetsp:Transcript_29199/g.88362  ORF Transcript_29199/g.88362 Transcript_29199/m.88362 type:complete len:206 (+) Transcript_29199:241-858(+)
MALTRSCSRTGRSGWSRRRTCGSRRLPRRTWATSWASRWAGPSCKVTRWSCVTTPTRAVVAWRCCSTASPFWRTATSTALPSSRRPSSCGPRAAPSGTRACTTRPSWTWTPPSRLTWAPGRRASPTPRRAACTSSSCPAAWSSPSPGWTSCPQYCGWPRRRAGRRDTAGTSTRTRTTSSSRRPPTRSRRTSSRPGTRPSARAWSP